MLKTNVEERIFARRITNHPWFLLQQRRELAFCNQKELNLSKSISTKFYRKTIFDELRTHLSGSLSLRKLILLNLASKISEETLAKERLSFQLINKSNSGSITPKELANYWKGHDPDLAQQVFKSIDLNGNGTIEYCVFLAALISRHVYRLTMPISK